MKTILLFTTILSAFAGTEIKTTLSKGGYEKLVKALKAEGIKNSDKRHENYYLDNEKDLLYRNGLSVRIRLTKKKAYMLKNDHIALQV